MRLRVSDKAAKQMGMTGSPEEAREIRRQRLEAERLEAEHLRAEKRRDQLALREQAKANRNSAIDADAALASAVAAFKSIESDTSAQNRKRSEEQISEALVAHESAERRIDELERALSEAKQTAEATLKRLEATHRRHQKTVVESDERLGVSLDAVRSTWDANEQAWQLMNRRFVKSKRDRVARRNAKIILGISKVNR